MTQKLRSSSTRIGTQSAEHMAFFEFDGLYDRLCQASFKDKFNDRGNLRPRGVAFLDFAGTRDPVAKVSDYLTDPHIHAVLLVHPQTRDRFEKFVRDRLADKVKQWPGTDSVVIKAFDPAKGAHDALISYCAKWVARNGYDFWQPYGTNQS